MPPTPPPFVRHGGAEPQSPVVLSVPHAGRAYPAQLRSMLRVPVARLAWLEDRLVDQVALAAVKAETLFVAQAPRAWIDLNRAEGERDPRIDAGAARGEASIKVRSGLGLVPRRTERCEDFWARRLSANEVAERITAVHRPYHAALAAALEAAVARFGIAVLLDLHSMPPVPPLGSGPQLVIGDRFGQSAAPRFAAGIEGVAHAARLRIAHNAPYAGAHILQRHGRPEQGIHAVQLEIDRRLYLDAAQDGLGPGLPAMAAVLRRMIDALHGAALPLSQAAE